MQALGHASLPHRPRPRRAPGVQRGRPRLPNASARAGGPKVRRRGPRLGRQVLERSSWRARKKEGQAVGRGRELLGQAASDRGRPTRKASWRADEPLGPELHFQGADAEKGIRNDECEVKAAQRCLTQRAGRVHDIETSAPSFLFLTPSARIACGSAARARRQGQRRAPLCDSRM